MRKKAVVNEVPNRLKEIDAAKVLGCSISTLRKQRMAGKGPAFYKYGNGHVRYDVADLTTYLMGKRITTSEQQK